MGLLAPESAISLIRGTSKTILLSVTTSAGKPVDLTGATLFFTVKVREEDEMPLIHKSSVDIAQIEVTDAIGGAAKIYLNPEDTHDTDIGQYMFDVWVVLSSLKRYVVIPPSTFEVLPGVTELPL